MNITQANNYQDMLSQMDKTQLENLLSQSPYFAVGHLLLAKSNFQSNPISSQESISRAALYTFDRNSLFEFIYFDEYFKTEIVNKDNLGNSDIESSQESFSNEDQNNYDHSQNEVVESSSIAEVDKVVETIEIENLNTPIETNTETSNTIESTVNHNITEPISQEIKPIKSKEKIIEEFIKNNPSVSKISDQDFAETILQANKSLEDNYDFVSETLADIYYKQGNKNKAIKIFQQLMLKYPEKKLYFAAQIDKIK